MREVDGICNAFIGGVQSESPDLDEEYDDPFRKLFEQGALAGTYAHSGWKHVQALAEETQDVDTRANAAMSKNRTRPAPARSDLDAPLTDDSQSLEKRYTAGIHSGKKAARVEKSANGKWVMEYDENDELIRGFAVDDEAA